MLDEDNFLKTGRLDALVHIKINPPTIALSYNIGIPGNSLSYLGSHDGAWKSTTDNNKACLLVCPYSHPFHQITESLRTFTLSLIQFPLRGKNMTIFAMFKWFLLNIK